MLSIKDYDDIIEKEITRELTVKTIQEWWCKAKPVNHRKHKTTRVDLAKNDGEKKFKTQTSVKKFCCITDLLIRINKTCTVGFKGTQYGPSTMPFSDDSKEDSEVD